MALTDVYLDDFGSFSGSTYTYRDKKGHEQTVTAINTLNGTGAHGYCIDDQLNGGSAFATGIKYAENAFYSGGYAIGTEDAYEANSTMFDASGAKGGAFLQLDLKGSGWMNKVIYEQEICGLCSERQITFSAAVGSINVPQAKPTNATIQVRLVDSKTNSVIVADGMAIDETYTLTSIGWEPAKQYNFKLPAGVECAKIQIISKEDDYDGDGRGDIALDDIIFRVCTPPSVEVDAKLSESSKAKDLLDLCVDDELILEALISKEAKAYYEKPKIGYLFQVTKKDPLADDFDPKKDWEDMGSVQEEEKYIIKDPANDPIFEGVENKTEIHFRVVIGEYDYLKNQRALWESLDELSPCRNVSFSSIPVSAALNCAACSHLDFEKTGVTFTADNGKFDAKNKVVELCSGETVELGIKDAVSGIDKDDKAYHGYLVNWYEKDVKSTSLVKKECSDTNYEAPTIKVSYDDVESAGKEGVKYIIAFHDNYDPSLSSTPCDMTDTITVIANPKPEEKLEDPDAFCEGTLEKEPIKTITGFDIDWYEDADTTSATDEPVIGKLTKADMPKSYYYVLTDSKTGCRGEANEYEIEVNKADANAIAAAKIEYKKTDAVGGTLPTLDIQNGAVFKPALAKSGYKLYIGLVEGATESLTPDLSTAKFGAASTTIPAPSIKDATSSDDEYLWYYTYMEMDPEGCLSDTVLVGVVIKGAPSPTPENAAYCVNSKTVAPMSSYATKAKEDPDGTLVFYGTDKTTKMSETDLPDVTKPGKYIYWVSQISSTGGGESSKQPIEIEVYGVNDVALAEPSAKYCKGTSAKALDDIATAKASSDEYVKNSGWEFFEGSEPSQNEETAGAASAMPISTLSSGEYKYYARLKYEVPNSTEVCYGKHEEYNVEVQSVADPVTGTVSYTKKEGEAGGFKLPTVQTPDAIVGDADCADCSIVWYKEDKTTKITEADATPKYSEVKDLEGNKEYQYYVKQVNALGCESDFKAVTIVVSGYPTPLVKNMSVCENSDKLKGTIQATAQGVSGGASASDFTLVWYKSNADGTMDESQEYTEIKLDPSEQPAATDGSKEKTYKYYVLQRLGTSKKDQSAAVAVTVTVNTNPKLKKLETDPKCKGESQKLSEMYNISIDGCSATHYDSNSGSMVTLASDVVTDGGLYNVKGWYVINKGTSDEETCASQPQDLEVVFHVLDANIVGSDRTCPGVAVDLEAKATLKLEESTKTAPIYYDWANDLNATSGTSALYNTGAAGLDAAGDKMKVTLTVSSDACKGSRAVTKTHIITVGDGPLVGKIAFSEAKNTSKKDESISSNNITFNSCGGNVDVELTGIVNKDGGSYTLSGASSKSGAFSSETSGSATLSLGEGKYTVSYVNECPTKFEFEIIDYSNTAESTNEKLTICENEAWSAEITGITGPKPTIEWQHNGVAMPGETNTKLQFKPAKPGDSGVYTYSLFSAGCQFDGKIALGDSLKVKPYVVIDENSYKAQYEVVNGNPIDIKLGFKVPSSESEIASDVKWSDVNTGYSTTGSSVNIDPVDTDYKFHVVAENKKYCKAETDITVLVDAKLKMTAELERSEICEGEKTTLIVDTTGTGKVLHKDGLVLKVEETSSEGKKTISLKPNKKTGKLEAEVSPTSDATYKVVYTYTVDSQDETKSLPIIVHEKFQVEWAKVDPVCEGDISTIIITKLYPNGTTLDWDDNLESESVVGTVSGATVQPTYTGTGVEEQIKSVKVIAKNGLCQDKPYMIPVPVHKPIEGKIKSADKICQYDRLDLDASSYQAETYEWEYIGQENTFHDAKLSLVPEPPYASFSLKMTRGECSLEVTKDVEVTSVPSVDRVDSLGIRQIEIVMETGAGTGEFKYIIDGDENDPEVLNPIRDNLEYRTHVVKVVDEVGCSTEFKFKVNNPAIEIPYAITPDGNGINDRFTVKGLAEGYPDANVRIYNRWGKQLASYKAGDGTDWDGVYNGSAMPSTDYWYEIEIKEIKKTFTGHFTLIRQ